MSPWRKNIAVKLPLFWFRSETCRNFGHVTLTHWVFKSFLAGICVQNFFESASKYVVGYIEFQYCFCWSRKLYSSLNVTLTYFLDQSMKLHILRRNQDFCCWFLLFDKWKQLRLMSCLLPFNTFYLELYLCHTNTGLFTHGNGKELQIHEVKIGSDLSM